LRELYKKRVIRERFRHRYEVNPEFMPTLEKHGMRFSAEGESGIVQAIEIPDHPFFLASQFHPEFLSSLEHPAPLFYGFVAACIEHKKQKK
jgi:CTP synthase